MLGRRLLDAALEALAAARNRLRRIERREASELRRWVQNTGNLLHLSIVLFIPVVIGFVTYLSNQVQTLSFLLFPPLASGTYTLVSDPEGQYADPLRFVASLTVGALCGLAAYTVTTWAYGPIETGIVHPESAALAIFLTGLVTWAARIEAPSAFSTALLALVTGDVEPVTYVASIFLAATVVATAFVVWREEFYEKRAQYLYETVHGDDHVLVPMRGETAEETATLAARVAAAHDAGKVVLLDVLDGVDADALAARRGEADPESVDEADAERVREAAERLNEVADRVQEATEVSCEVIVASGDPASTSLATAERANCDLIVTPYETEDGALAPHVRRILSGPVDAIAHRSTGPSRWRRVLVPIARPGDSAHAMMDFGTRLAGDYGRVSACTCIGSEVERRDAEHRLANIVETFDAPVETRVARAEITEYIAENAGAYDLVMLGSSGERSAASRLISPPTFERLRDVDCDVAVVDCSGR